MLSRPLFKPHLQLELLLPDQVVVFSERRYSLLRGEIYVRLSSLIDGVRTSQEISRHLEAQFSALEVCYALDVLERQGYVLEAEAYSEGVESNYWFEQDLDPIQIRSTLGSAPIQISCFASERFSPILKTWIESLTQALSEENISVSQKGDLELVVTDDYLREELATNNQRAIQKQQHWILIRPVGMKLFLGPLFIPGKTACWQCFADRYRRNQPLRSFIENRSKKQIYPVSAVSSTALRVGLGFVVEQIIQCRIHDPAPTLIDTLLTLDISTLTLEKHSVTKRPQCPICGDPQLQASQMITPISLSSCPKRFTSDGGHRIQDPETTLHQYQHLISPISGIVRELERTSSKDEALIHNYRAPHWFPEPDLKSIQMGLKISRSGGKGKTSTQARASGLGEAIERYSGCFHGDEYRRSARFYDLGDQAIDPNQCMLFSEAQYRDRQHWNRSCQRNQIVPDPFNPEQEISWSPVWSLTHQVFKYLPTAYCFYGYVDDWEKHVFCTANSNGCATGNRIEEAILQGFMELAERDCVAIWWYNQLRFPQVDLESFDDPYFLRLAASYRLSHRDLWVLDITHDLDIPTFAALSRTNNGSQENIIFGFGSHFDARIALSRALTEMNQMRGVLTLRSHEDHPSIPERWMDKRLDELSYLSPDPQQKPRTTQDYLDRSSADICDDVLLCQSLVREKQMELLVMNQTRPDIGLPTVRVIVPGLRHFWKRWAPGRLYDVPLNMGWLQHPTREEQLNPIPIFF